MVDAPSQRVPGQQAGEEYGAGKPYDPSKNVLDTITSQIARQDDLRSAAEKHASHERAALRDLVMAKFDGIDREFALIESRRIEQKNDTKTAVDAALSAAERAVREQSAASEKAIIKSETSVAAQSLQQAQTFSAQLRGVETAVNDIKERLGKFETQTQTKNEGRTSTRSDIGMWVGLAGILIAAFALGTKMFGGG